MNDDSKRVTREDIWRVQHDENLPPIALRVEHGDDGAIRYERLDDIPTELTAPLGRPTASPRSCAARANGSRSAPALVAQKFYEDGDLRPGCEVTVEKLEETR